MAKIVKIKVASFGASIDTLNIVYNITGDTNYRAASTACGCVASNLTQTQLLNGYVVSLPDNAANVAVVSAAGICAGTIVSVSV